MILTALVERAHASQDYTELLAVIPYARTIGLECHRFGDDVIFRLPQQDSNIGNPVLPAIHGGVLGGFMELSASLYLLMFQPVPQMPKIVDFSIDFLRAGLNRDTFVECELTRQGNRVANVIIHAWQKSRQDPIALARAHFLFKTAKKQG
jgi:acyl-coenzyme A thioesterase PaaI-like protein